MVLGAQVIKTKCPGSRHGFLSLNDRWTLAHKGRQRGESLRENFVTSVETSYFTTTSGLPPWYIASAQLRFAVVLYGAVRHGHANGGRGPRVVGPHQDRLPVPSWVNRIG